MRWLILNNLHGRNGLLGFPDSEAHALSARWCYYHHLTWDFGGSITRPFHISCVTNDPGNVAAKSNMFLDWGSEIQEWISSWACYSGLLMGCNHHVLHIYKAHLKAKTMVYEMHWVAKCWIFFSFRVGDEQRCLLSLFDITVETPVGAKEQGDSIVGIGKEAIQLSFSHRWCVLR